MNKAKGHYKLIVIISSIVHFLTYPFFIFYVVTLFSFILLPASSKKSLINIDLNRIDYINYILLFVLFATVLFALTLVIIKWIFVQKEDYLKRNKIIFIILSILTTLVLTGFGMLSSIDLFGGFKIGFISNHITYMINAYIIVFSIAFVIYYLFFFLNIKKSNTLIHFLD